MPMQTRRGKSRSLSPKGRREQSDEDEEHREADASEYEQEEEDDGEVQEEGAQLGELTEEQIGALKMAARLLKSPPKGSSGSSTRAAVKTKW